MDSMFNVARNDVCSEEEDIMKYWECLFNAWKDVPEEYKKYMELLEERCGQSFEDYPPLQLVGDFWGRPNKVLVVSLQPYMAGDKAYRKFEQEERGIKIEQNLRKEVSWSEQLIFSLKYFKLLREKTNEFFPLERLEQLMRYYEHSATQKNLLYEVLHQRVVQAFLVPYFAGSISLPALNGLVTQSFKRIKDFFLGNEFDLIVLEGEKLLDQLVKDDLVVRSGEQVVIIDTRGKERILDVFMLEIHFLKQKGLVLPEGMELDNDQLKILAREMRKLTEWNRDNYWKSNF